MNVLLKCLNVHMKHTLVSLLVIGTPSFKSLKKIFISNSNTLLCFVCIQGLTPLISSRFPITMAYKPEIETEVNFNIMCRVRQKTTPLTVNVKGRGFQVDMEVICEDSSGQKIVLSQLGNNVINFGNVSDISVSQMTFR